MRPATIVVTLCLWRVGLFNIDVAEENKTYLEKVVIAVEKAIEFFGQHYADLNLDAVIGTRIVEGQCTVLLENLLRSKPSITKLWLVQTISDIRDMAGLVSDKATPYIKTLSPVYYNDVGETIARHFWEVNHASRNLGLSTMSLSLSEQEVMHEADSDTCLTELFGSRNSQKCNISDSCWKLMTGDNYYGYSLTHQVFYLAIGEQFGCRKQMVEKINKNHQNSIRHLHEAFCTNMLQAAEKIADQGFPESKQDLFMEQGALCGLLGYRQFTRPEWLDAILSWQKPSGCFGEVNEYKGFLENNGSNVFKRRLKREERPLPGDCLAHATAVAVSCLSQYLRYIVEYTVQQEQLEEAMLPKLLGPE